MKFFIALLLMVLCTTSVNIYILLKAGNPKPKPIELQATPGCARKIAAYELRWNEAVSIARPRLHDLPKPQPVSMFTMATPEDLLYGRMEKPKHKHSR